MSFNFNEIGQENTVGKDMRMIMIHFGFDFSLIGSVYIYELLQEFVSNTNLIRCEKMPTMTILADRHNVKIKTLNRVIRWAIVKAYSKGLLKYVPFFEGMDSAPPTRQVLSWLFNFYLYQQD